MKSYQNIFFQITPKFLRKQHWILFWIGLALFGGIFSISILYIIQEEFSLVSLVSFWALFVFFPIINYWFEKKSRELCGNLLSVFKDPDKFQKWYQDFFRKIFSIKKNYFLWCLIFVIFIFENIVLFASGGIPLSNQIFSLVSYFVFFIPAFFAGQGAYLILSYIYFLFCLNKMEIIGQYYYRIEGSPFQKLIAVSMVFCVFIILGFVFTFLLIWFSPLGLTIYFQIFLIVISFFPIAQLILSILLIIKFQSNISNNLIILLNRYINKRFQGLDEDNSEKDLEKILKLLEINKIIHESRKLPKGVINSGVFFVSIILPIAQILVSIYLK